MQSEVMRWTDGYIAVDWGSTNRRAYRVDGVGACDATLEDGCGVLSVESGGFPAAVDQIRGQLGDLPLLLAGMVGSTRGWVEAPYVSCPAGIEDLADRLCWVEPGKIAIVPGLSVLDGDKADVMRGEEVQMFGAVETGLVPADGVVCHPGTHNKWVDMQGGKVSQFRTVMTGELFNLLRKGGLLAEMLAADVTPGEAFRAGVRRGGTAPPLTAELFSIRARVLLGDLPIESAASFTSGLLIGLDFAAGIAIAAGREIAIMGRPELTSLYAEAATVMGYTAREVDGSEAFLAGASAIARKVQ